MARTSWEQNEIDHNQNIPAGMIMHIDEWKGSFDGANVMRSGNFGGGK